jgi:hypothetical protein
MARHGRKLIWLQTFGERFGTDEISTSGVAWTREPTRLAQTTRDYRYDAVTETIHVADGSLTGVPEAVWKFAVSGMPVVPKWLGYRMAKPTGRAASSTSALDHIRPEGWMTSWSTELVQVVASIKETLAMIPDGVALLDQITAGPLIAAGELPQPPAALRQPPPRDGGNRTLFVDGDLD